MFAAAVVPAAVLATGMLFMSHSPRWLATVSNWSANLLVTVTFLSMITAIGKAWTFWVYAIMAGLAIIFVFFFVPETMGRPLEHIDKYWTGGHRWPEEEPGQRAA
jgi:hypothetical protein